MRALLTVILFSALAACSGDGRENLPGMVAEKMGHVPGPGACGVDDAYVVTYAAGVRLSQPATLSREVAVTLDRWLRRHAIPAIGKRGGGLREISVPSHYACRTRNNRPEARLSEHAKGRAIDISAFVLADGTRLTVLGEWSGPNSKLLRKLHSSACGPFGTVLGPNSDPNHQDHFHFDVADYRSGSYCR